MRVKAHAGGGTGWWKWQVDLLARLERSSGLLRLERVKKQQLQGNMNTRHFSMMLG